MNIPLIYMDQCTCRMFRAEIENYFQWIEKRLFSTVVSWEDESGRASEDYDEKVSAWFNPEEHDPGDVCEAGYDYVVAATLQAAEFNCYMTGMAIVGLYHLWERQVFNHLAKELRTDFKIVEENPEWPIPHLKRQGDCVFKLKKPCKWDDIIDLFDIFSASLEKEGYFNGLNELRLVANVVKHGDGPSYEKLKEMGSDILHKSSHEGESPMIGGRDSLLGVDIYPCREHFVRFKEAAVNFWSYDSWRNRDGGERLMLDLSKADRLKRWIKDL